MTLQTSLHEIMLLYKNMYLGKNWSTLLQSNAFVVKKSMWKLNIVVYKNKNKFKWSENIIYQNYNEWFIYIYTYIHMWFQIDFSDYIIYISKTNNYIWIWMIEEININLRNIKKYGI